MLELSTDAKFKTMLVDMLRYGSIAQKYTNFNINNLADSALTEEQEAFGTTQLRELTSVSQMLPKEEGDSAEWLGLTLNLDNKVAIVGYFDAVVTEGMYVKVTDKSGNLIGTVSADTFTQVTGPAGTPVNAFVFAGLDVSQMSEVVHLYVCDSNGDTISSKAIFSIESYVKTLQSSTIPNLSNLVEAMMKYGDSVKAFVG